MFSGPDFAKMHSLLVERYSLEELRTLCAELSVPFDDLGGEGRQAKARELILWLRRRDLLDALVAALSAQQREPWGATSAPAEPSREAVAGNVDLAIVTAMPEELEPVLDLIGGREHWQQFLLDRFVHHRAQFVFESGPLAVVACSLWKYGGNPVSSAIARLGPLRPKLIVMTGICAGWELKGIDCGDVIVADRAFHAGEGKQSAQGFVPDTRTYQPPPWLMQWLADFSTDRAWFKDLKTPRPPSLRYRIDWLLCRMAERGAAYPETDDDWREAAANQIAVPPLKELLREQGLIASDGRLTERAAARLAEIRQQNHGRLAPAPDRQWPAVHYGAFASAEAVVAVEQPFDEHAERVRGVRAIDLEVASLFAAAAEIGVPAFAVKGVSDYGTPTKDDAFHRYAAEAAARWMYQFIRTYAQHL